MRARLYAIPGSHPSMAGQLMLERKGIEVRRVDLPPVVPRALLRLLGYPGGTVPAVRVDGTRIQGTRNLSRALDTLVPEPRLFSQDPERRRAEEEAEAWGDEVLQPVARRLIWWGLKRDRAALRTFLEGPLLGLPPGLAARTAPPLTWGARRLNHVSDESAETDLAALPGLLDHADALVTDGVIDPDQPGAAAFQVATSLRLLMCFEDLRPVLAARPAGRAAERIVPHFPGSVGPVLPPEALAALR